jgi:hypothetical protein
MGNHNNIHDYNDEHYYYCTIYDCACGERNDYYSSSDYSNNSAANVSIPSDYEHIG